MNYVSEISTGIADFLSKITESKYIYLMVLSFFIFIIISLIKKGMEKYYIAFQSDQKKRYEYNYKGQIVLNIIAFVILFLVWESYLSSLITLISFISAGATIALREIIFNFFAGIYIRVNKPFAVEDRIEVKDIKGDVVKLNYLNFEVLEIGDRINGEQSSGLIVSFPNSFALTEHVKNYVKEFKYIWNELTIMIPMDSDIDGIKKEIQTIIKSNEILKKVPKKMENQIDEISLNYRIYFNNLEPVIYTKIVDSHIELYARYLVNPKKARYVEDKLWNQIIKAYQEKRIDLFINHKDR